jgi:hypothetical protein
VSVFAEDCLFKGAIMSVVRRQLREGSVLNDRYQVEGFLGTGETGDVYACRDIRNQKSRIVKTL